MGLFSGKKEGNGGQGNSIKEGVPADLPFTIIDKLSSEGSSGTVENVQSHQNSQQNSIQNTTPKTVAKPPAQKIVLSQGQDWRKIPSDIVHEHQDSRFGRPSEETRYVPVAHSSGDYESFKEYQDFLDFKRSLLEKKHVGSAEAATSIHEKNSSLDGFHSFFSGLEKHIIHDKSLGHKQLDSRFLINKMKEYHESVKTGNGFILHEKDAEKQITRKIEELKELESDWLYRRKELDAAEMFLAEKELEIETKFDELRKLMVSADKNSLFNRKCPDDRAFVMHKGGSLHSVQELLYELPKMSDEAFFFHVNASKNDFSAWINGVFGSEELSNLIKTSNSRQDMINKLKNF